MSYRLAVILFIFSVLVLGIIVHERTEIFTKNPPPKTGQLEMVLLLLNQSIRGHPNLAESWYTRGVANFRLERYEEACRDWKKACGLEVGWCLGEEYAIAGKICP